MTQPCPRALAHAKRKFMRPQLTSDASKGAGQAGYRVLGE